MTRLLLLAAGVCLLAGLAGADEPQTVQLVTTIPLQGKAGRLDHLAIDTRHARLFIANLSNDSLDVVDLETKKLVKQIPGQKKIQGVAYATDFNTIFVGNGTDGVCNVFSGDDYKLLKSIKLPDADNARYDSDRRAVYVTHAEDAISVIDARTQEVKGTIKLPGAPEALQIDSERKRLYVNCLKPALVAVVDLEKNEVIARYPLKLADANYPLALDTKGQRIFVGCRKEPAVVVLDAKSGKELAAVPIPGDIDDLFYDRQRNRLYATCGEGVLAVLQEKDGAFKVVEKIPTGKLARTGLFDPESSRLFVPVPRQEGQGGPELRVFRARN
jgi:DNA-binding beta-propeller fold protein YncE